MVLVYTPNCELALAFFNKDEHSFIFNYEKRNGLQGVTKIINRRVTKCSFVIFEGLDGYDALQHYLKCLREYESEIYKKF